MAALLGTILSGIGLDWAISSWNDSKVEERNQKIGKIVLGVAAVYGGLLLVKKLR